jgi:hypothetical protein
MYFLCNYCKFPKEIWFFIKNKPNITNFILIKSIFFENNFWKFCTLQIFSVYSFSRNLVIEINIWKRNSTEKKRQQNWSKLWSNALKTDRNSVRMGKFFTVEFLFHIFISMLGSQDFRWLWQIVKITYSRSRGLQPVKFYNFLHFFIIFYNFFYIKFYTFLRFL